MTLALWALLQSETESACAKELLWLARRQKDDGGWGPADASSLALLAFVGAGYTHASKDAYSGVCFGSTVKKGVEHLSATDPAALSIHAAALRTLALCEHYGHTGGLKFKSCAEAAAEDLLKRQEAVGGWGAETAWVAAALKSADLSGLKVDRALLAKAIPVAERQWEPDLEATLRSRSKPADLFSTAVESLGHDDPDVRDGAGAFLVASGDAAGAALLDASKSSDPEVAARAGAALDDLILGSHAVPYARAVGGLLLLKKLKGDAMFNVGSRLLTPPADPPAEYWYWASLAAWRIDGPGGPHWTAFREHRFEFFRKTRSADGSWNAPTEEDQIRVTALHWISSWIGVR